MLERQVLIPASPEHLWSALTDPDELVGWFGSEVEWELRPGGGARFEEADGSIRRGLVETVLPWRRLSFRWWPEGDADRQVSRVTYTLEPDEEGTRLTVTEQPLVAAHGAASGPAAQGGAPGPAAGPVGSPAVHAEVAGGSWTGWDSRLFQCWARVDAMALVGGAGR